MKITIDLPDDLLFEAQAHAAKTGQTLQALIERGLRLALAHDAMPVTFGVGPDRRTPAPASTPATCD